MKGKCKMAKGGAHKMPNGKMMKDAAMKGKMPMKDDAMLMILGSKPKAKMKKKY